LVGGIIVVISFLSQIYYILYKKFNLMSRTFFDEVTEKDQTKFLIFLIDMSFHFNVSVFIVKVYRFYFFN